MDLDPGLLEDIRRNLNECRAFGSDDFKEEIEGKLKRRIKRSKPGRKKKRVKPAA